MRELEKLALAGLAAAAVPFTAWAGAAEAGPGSINSGMSGSWYDPAVPGQGLLIDVISGREELFGAWFTFGADGARWLTLQGGYAGTIAELTVYETSGGEFNEPTPVVTGPVGQATIDFLDCTKALLSFDIDGKGAGQISLSRLSPDVSCADFSAQPSMPLFFRLDGKALTFDEDGNSADCALELIYEIDLEASEPGLVIYRGVHGGLVMRTTLDPTGAGFQFFADVFDPDSGVTWTDPNKVTIDGPGVADDEHPLWRGLTSFDGLLDAHGRGVGGWTCAAFEFAPESGFNDNGIVATGTWFIRPIADENQSGKSLRGHLGPAGGPETRALSVRPIRAPE